jgi:uncharacterized protein
LKPNDTASGAQKANPRKRHPVWHVIRCVLGAAFMVFGVIGLFLPVLQGVLFLLFGVILLAPYVPFLRKLRLKFFIKFPGVHEKIKSLKKRWRSRRMN